MRNVDGVNRGMQADFRVRLVEYRNRGAKNDEDTEFKVLDVLYASAREEEMEAVCVMQWPRNPFQLVLQSPLEKEMAGYRMTHVCSRLAF